MQLGGSCALNGELPLWSVIIVWLACTVPVARGAAGLIDDLTRAVGRSSNGITGLSHEQTMGAEGYRSASAIWSGNLTDDRVSGPIVYGRRVMASGCELRTTGQLSVP